LQPALRAACGRSSSSARASIRFPCATRLPTPAFVCSKSITPATQAWKRERLKEAGLALPASLTFVPIDFERQSLAKGLAGAGFRSDCPAFFQWLGVVVYLSREAILVTLDVIASIPASAVVFEYTEPFENHSPEGCTRLMAAAERAAARGEPWLSFFNPTELSAILRGKGFTDVEDLRVAEMVKRYPSALATGLSISPGGHVVRAEKRRMM